MISGESRRIKQTLACIDVSAEVDLAGTFDLPGKDRRLQYQMRPSLHRHGDRLDALCFRSYSNFAYHFINYLDGCDWYLTRPSDMYLPSTNPNPLERDSYHFQDSKTRPRLEHQQDIDDTRAIYHSPWTYACL